jgi:hypothetical protein
VAGTGDATSRTYYARRLNLPLTLTVAEREDGSLPAGPGAVSSRAFVGKGPPCHFLSHQRSDRPARVILSVALAVLRCA